MESQNTSEAVTNGIKDVKISDTKEEAVVLPVAGESKVIDSEANGKLPASPPQPQVPKVKRDFYQTDTDVVVNILAKNLKKEEVKVEYTAETVSIEAKLADGTDYAESIQLFSTINPSSCSYKVLSTKIEIRLRKALSCTWVSVEAKEVEPSTDIKPSYPTSSKNKKDWGKVEKEIEKEIPEGDDVNNLFSKIFESGDENTKRAMMKSMQESGGTVLSTNWEEVGKKPVEVSPPDGMEWKKWDS